MPIENYNAWTTLFKLNVTLTIHNEHNKTWTATLYDIIADIPNDAPDLRDQCIAALCEHIDEIYSPPRVTLIARQHGREPSTAYDANVCDEQGRPWNFDYPEHRERAVKIITNEQPALLIGSPMCTPFSALMQLNKDRMNIDKWNAMYAWALQHLRFTIQLYKLQLKAGRHILHEHPTNATSWHLPEMLEFMAEHNLDKFTGHMCRFELTTSEEQGEGLVKKPPGFLTSSPVIRGRLEVNCVGGHRHIPLMGGKAKECQGYPPKLCHAIAAGLREQLIVEGHTRLINPSNDVNTMLNTGHANDEIPHTTITILATSPGRFWTRTR